MELGFAIALPMIFFLGLDILILINTCMYRNRNRTRSLFINLTTAAAVQQFCGMMVYLYDYHILITPIAIQYILYILMFSALSYIGYLWFMYLRTFLTDNRDAPPVTRALSFLPLILIAVASAVSPWTHIVFYFDAEGVYQHGPLYVLQYVCSYIYIVYGIVVLIRFALKGGAVYREKVFAAFFALTIPTIIGSALQLFVFGGGYTMISTSVTVIIMYLTIYLKEIDADRRLAYAEQLNSRMRGEDGQKAAGRTEEKFSRELREHLPQTAQMEAEQKAHFDAIIKMNEQLRRDQEEQRKSRKVIEALSSSYLNVYLIRVDTGMLEVVKQSGFISPSLADKKEQYPFSEITRNYIETDVHPEDRELVASKVDLNKIIDGTADGRTYEFSYRAVENGETHYYQGSYHRIDEDYIVAGFQYVDSLILEEEQQKEALKVAKTAAEAHSKELSEELDIINTVAKAYTGLYYVDLETETFTELGVNNPKISSIIGKTGSARHSFEQMCKYLVIPAHAQAMLAFTELGTLAERLKGRRWISRQFFSPDGIWMEGIFIAADSDAEGKFNHVIWATRNIDERKKKEIAYQQALEKATEAAKAASEAKTAFLFNMSHDIRTPMNAIIGYTNLIKRHGDDPERCREYFEKIETSSEFLLSLINNVLEMARIESGKVTLNEEVCRTGFVRDEIRDVYSELMKEKHISFTQVFDVTTPYVYADKVKLNEVFLNLVSNAYKYTPEGGSVEMAIRELPSEKDGYTLIEVTVKDTGIGMSREFLPTIFEQFAREHTATESKVQGTGLGMPIVKRLVEQMGGAITVESELGKGSTFVVTIPHRIAPAPEQAAENSEQSEKDFTGRRILLAEDNELNAEIAIEILSDEGLLVERAEDGAVCVDMLKHAEPGYYDVILMDIQMPNMNGYEAAKAIRNLGDPARSGIPIIAMTANAFDEDKKNALDAGMNAHLAKPIDVRQLMDTLGEFLK